MIIEVDPSAATLLDFHRRPIRRAGNGKPGSGSNRSGAEGADLVLRVPDGTVVKTDDGEVLADLIGAVHCALLVIAFLTLPLSIAAGWGTPPSLRPGGRPRASRCGASQAWNDA